MREGWKEVELGKIITGYFDGPHATPKPSENGAIFLGIKNVTEDGRLDMSEIRRISEEELPRWTKRVTPQCGDIVLSYEATLHRYAMIPNNFRGCLGRRMALIRVNKDVADNYFIFKYFLSNVWRKEVEKHILTGSTVDRIPIGELPQFKLYIPPLPTQRKIASILSSYDDLIENNLKRIKLLEEKAQRTYEEWFVKMRFPGHETAVFNEVDLTDLALYFGRGVTPQYEDGSGFWGINQKANKGSNLEKIHFKEYKKGNWIPIERFAKNGDILLNSLGEGTIGRCHYYKWKSDVYPVDQHMTIFRGKSGQISLFVFHFLASEHGQGILNSLKKGGTNMTMLNIGDLRTIRIKIPDSKILNSFFDKVEILYDLKSILENQNGLLKEARDILLPRLMSGMVDVEKLQIETIIK